MASGNMENSDTLHEYTVLYTVNGKGYTDTEPWIDAKTEDPTEARQAYESLVDWCKTDSYKKYDVWMEAREISPWKRVDPDSLSC